MIQGQVVKLDRGYPLVRLDDGTEVRCEHATSLVKRKSDRAVIGDEVLVSLPDRHEKGVIEQVLPRRTSFVRKDPTERALPQTLAANFDLVLVAQPIDQVNTRRLERELVLAHETGAPVVVILTKADLISQEDCLDEVLASIKGFVGNDQVLTLSGEDPESIDCVAKLISSDGGKTAILVGRSGVGKSTLVNMLVGSEVQRTAEVRQDGKGRHTTVSRQIIDLPLGGSIVDMPGVRGLGLWDADEGIEAAFTDVEKLAQQCRFRDCSHQREPGCAVRAAVESGELSPLRLESYLRLKDESRQVKKKREEAERIRTRKGHPRRRKG